MFRKIFSKFNICQSLDNSSVSDILRRKSIHTCRRSFTNINSVSSKQTRFLSNLSKPIILGIESSCDDTGAAIIDGSGKVLGQSLYSQIEKTVMFGGVIPVISLKYHEMNIEKAVTDVLEKAKLTFEDLTAVAVTVHPGNKGNLRAGCRYAKNICRIYNKPLIPVHHMEAHALTVRMIEKVEFPYLTALISGGHFIFAVGRGINDWVVLMDESTNGPGCSLDHIARNLKLKNIKDYESVCGGRAIEMAAKGGDCKKYTFCTKPKCTPFFSLGICFSGLRNAVKLIVQEMEEERGIEGGEVLEDYKDICASIQYTATKKIIRETEKAMACAASVNLIPEDCQRLVISGGVMCNQYIRENIAKMCEFQDYSFHAPPPLLCTDNGVMIAWAGLEQWRTNKNVLFKEEDYANLRVQTELSMGTKYEQSEFRYVRRPEYMKF